jgi:hypothetical protein
MTAKETPTREGVKTAMTTKKAANPKRGTIDTNKHNISVSAFFDM